MCVIASLLRYRNEKCCLRHLSYERRILTGLSGDHFEHCNNDYQQILKSLKARGFEPKKKGCFAKLNCGEVICKTQKRCKISFTKDDENHSHTLMIGLTIGDNSIPASLVTLVKEIEPLNNYETNKIERE
jgi:hypothetical protein